MRYPLKILLRAVFYVLQVDFWGRLSYTMYDDTKEEVFLIMKLSTAILADKLKSKFGLQNKKALSDELHLEQVLFYDDGDEMQPDKIYIYTQKPGAAEMLVVPERTVLFCMGKVHTRNTENDGQVFQVIDETSPFTLLNEIQRIFDYYDRWEKRLQELTRQADNIQELLDESFRIFLNPIIVSSADYFVIGYSSVIDTREELSSLVDLDSVIQSSDEYQNGKRILNQRKKRGSYYLPEYITGARTLRVNLFENAQFIYQIMMVESLSRFKSYDGALLEYLSAYIQTALARLIDSRVEIGHRLDRILSDILSNPGRDNKSAEKWFSEFGWLATHRYFCVSLKVNSLDWANMTVRFICKHMESMLGKCGSCAFQYENNIAIFVNLTLMESGAEEVLEKMESFLKDTFLKAGVSNEFTGFEQLDAYYRQAVTALDVGCRRKPYRWIYRFDEVALDYVLERSSSELPVRLVCSDRILKLQAYDEAHHTDYYHTLKTYVESQLNAVQTAKKLFIHRSTFLYRMEKIEELVKLDLNDYDTLLYVMMTFRILEQEEQK